MESTLTVMEKCKTVSGIKERLFKNETCIRPKYELFVCSGELIFYPPIILTVSTSLSILVEV